MIDYYWRVTIEGQERPRLMLHADGHTPFCNVASLADLVTIALHVSGRTLCLVREHRSVGRQDITVAAVHVCADGSGLVIPQRFSAHTNDEVRSGTLVPDLYRHDLDEAWHILSHTGNAR